jgi:hypothetical protein
MVGTKEPLTGHNNEKPPDIRPEFVSIFVHDVSETCGYYLP